MVAWESKCRIWATSSESYASFPTDGTCWGPSASEGPQKHDLTMFLEYNT
jgi:hypothetical protein